MALFTELPVYCDTYKLSLLLYETTNNFSRVVGGDSDVYNTEETSPQNQDAVL